MATKTISIDLVAYEKLNAARLGPRDSFSQVIRRAHWDQAPKTCGGLLSAMSGMPVADEDVIRHLDSAQQQDLPPDDPWS
jgi:predicted CopG family antitoxin